MKMEGIGFLLNTVISINYITIIEYLRFEEKKRMQFEKIK